MPKISSYDEPEKNQNTKINAPKNPQILLYHEKYDHE